MARKVRSATPIKPPSIALTPPLRVSVAEGARLLSISRALLYQRITAGKIAVIKDSKRTLIAMDELRRYSNAGY